MPAFTLQSEHISVMLQAAAPKCPGDDCASYYWRGKSHYFHGRNQEVGQILMDENSRSVNCCFEENNDLSSYCHISLLPFSMIEIIKACHSYIYQSNQTLHWKESEACAIVRALETRAIHNLPGYEAASWEIIV